MVISNEGTSSSNSNLTELNKNEIKQPHYQENFNRPLRWFKLFCGTASTIGFIYGLRIAWVQSKLKPGELPRTNLLSGAGYISLVVLISEAMSVNTFKEFGIKTRLLFGDRFRISKGKSAEEKFESLSDLFEKFQKEGNRK
ncbi:hypothetical protein Mgra_00005676 [Meloidogyne graminicola]|uniref:Transmembrane protein 242 n=1 Tax=Meloidogyne graminicola TaxID=189291 RepID=A0A8S9ZNR7_9BILA|nr:hypothetical protein Mgra_00005676 [Meloidogyne graminicola]